MTLEALKARNEVAASVRKAKLLVFISRPLFCGIAHSSLSVQSESVSEDRFHLQPLLGNDAKTH